MTRKYMDDTVLAMRKEKEEMAVGQRAAEVITQEIGSEEIREGQVMICGNNISFVPHRLLEEQIQLILPEQWTELAPELGKIKYPYESRPPIIMSDPTTLFNLTINLTTTPLKLQEIAIGSLVKEMKYITEKYLKACFFEEGMMETDDDKLLIGWYDFSVPSVSGEDLYNIVFCTSLADHALILSFNCPDGEKVRWKSLAQAMLGTLTFVTPTLVCSHAKKEERKWR